ncbi:MAG: uracil-DNA glycosylase family protein [Treponema sp.]|nr:uracil-DNA glycosylase family protein [Treponema sp.]
MNKDAWAAFEKARRRFRGAAEETDAALPALIELQKRLVDGRGGPAYTVQTPVVYNEALDEVGPQSLIKLILVGDNPGRREQAARRYLVGPSGKIAENFFRSHPELGIDFRENVIILNKTPVHTPRTAELKELRRFLDTASNADAFNRAMDASQRVMAGLVLEFQKALSAGASGEGIVPVWITGYSEMKKGGIFEVYTETLRDLYLEDEALLESLFFYRHFSMNQFTIDLRQKTEKEGGKNTAEILARIGADYRKRILGR